MKLLRLTREKSTIIDDEDLNWLSLFKWHLSTKGYAIHSLNNGENISMHKLIMSKNNLYIEGREIDHKNRNKLDNRKINLRNCTSSENKANIKITKSNKSGYRGVCWKKERKKWESHITYQKKYYFLGYFSNKKEANNAYINKSKELHKKFSIYR